MRISLLATALMATSVLSGGCAVYPAHQPHYEYGQPIALAPPPAPYENPGWPPSPGFIWISGYWDWTGARYGWVPGRWETPRPGRSWVPHRWEREGDHWRQHGGTWKHEAPHQPISAPPPVRQIEHRDDRHPLTTPAVRPAPVHAPRAEPKPATVPQRESRHPSEGGRPFKGRDATAEPRQHDKPDSGSDKTSRPEHREIRKLATPPS